MTSGFIVVSCAERGVKLMLRASCVECVYFGNGTTFIDTTGREKPYRVKEPVMDVLLIVAQAEGVTT